MVSPVDGINEVDGVDETVGVDEVDVPEELEVPKRPEVSSGRARLEDLEELEGLVVVEDAISCGW